MKLSIIVVNHNYERFLPFAVDSALIQWVEEMERKYGHLRKE